MASQIVDQTVDQSTNFPLSWENFFRQKFASPSGIKKSSFTYLAENGLPQRGSESWPYSSFKAEDLPPPHLSAEINLKLRSRASSPEIRNFSYEQNFSEFSETLEKWNSLFLGLKRQKRRVLATPKPLEPFCDGSEAFHEAFVDRFVLVRTRDVSSDLEIELQDSPHLLDRELLFPRLLIEVLPGHELTLTSHFLCQRSSLLSKIQILLREGARLNWVCIQNNSKQSLHVDQIEIIAEEESSGHAFFVNSGSRMSRQNVRLTFAQKKSGFKIHGLCLADGDQHFDVSTVIEHLKGENFSEQIFKSVLGGRAKSVFSGLVYIEKDAQLAHSSQLNKSLLLSRGAEAISQPQLEIYADDVKATHGSTVGQIQSEEIFYLRSRAISEPEAISLLCEGFASELVFSISDVDQKNYLLNFLKSRVRELRA